MIAEKAARYFQRVLDQKLVMIILIYIFLIVYFLELILVIMMCATLMIPIRQIWSTAGMAPVAVLGIRQPAAKAARTKPTIVPNHPMATG